ncbi:MAG: aminoacyl-tRNA hydrolase [candidate division Zixibacteria bacterium]|nr:aminoacyl-tRNA hydrolase [candidate division Zixibacteria bacterium]
MIKAIIGLGNIGEKYQGTRHNVGFAVIILLGQELKSPKPAELHYSTISKTDYQDSPVYLVKPTTMMNGSGYCAGEILDSCELKPDNLLIIVDDFNLPLGAIRFRSGGSAGGHNGLESIIEELETEDFPRLRLGIGPIPDDINEVDFVLGKFDQKERPELNKMLGVAAEAVIFALGHELEMAMTKYNYNPA